MQPRQLKHGVENSNIHVIFRKIEKTVNPVTKIVEEIQELQVAVRLLSSITIKCLVSQYCTVCRFFLVVGLVFLLARQKEKLKQL